MNGTEGKLVKTDKVIKNSGNTRVNKFVVWRLSDGQIPSDTSYDILSAGDIKITELQNTTPCILVKTYTRLGGECFLRTQQLVHPNLAHLYQTLQHHLPQGKILHTSSCAYICGVPQRTSGFDVLYHVHSEIETVEIFIRSVEDIDGQDNTGRNYATMQFI